MPKCTTVRRALLVTGIVVLVAAALTGGYIWGHSSNNGNASANDTDTTTTSRTPSSNLSGSTTSWTREYC